MIKRFKDNIPDVTVRNIKSWLEPSGINIVEKKVQNTYGLYSILLQLENTALFVNGKGSDMEFAVASAYGELCERIASGVLFRFHGKEKLSVLEKSPHTKLSDFRETYKELTSFNVSEEEVKELQEYFFIVDKDGILTEEYESIIQKDIKILPVSIIDTFYNTNGLSCGNSQSEAQIQALCEICERYVNREVLLREVKLPRSNNWKEKISFELLKKIDTIIQAYNLKIDVLDASKLFGLPVVSVILRNSEGKYFVKFGSHFSFEIALERCMTELFQGRNVNNGFWKDIIYEESQEFKVTNLERNMKDGDGYYPLNFLNPTEEVITDFSFGSTNVEAVNTMLNILDKFNSDILYKEYKSGDIFVLRYIIPGISNTVVNKESILNKYRRTVFIERSLEQFIDIDMKSRELVLESLKEMLTDHNISLFNFTKYPLKNKRNTEFITLNYLSKIHCALNSDENLCFDIKALDNNAKKNTSGKWDKNALRTLLKYPDFKEGDVVLEDKTISLNKVINEYQRSSWRLYE